jgi:hypothetical protein
MHTVSRCSAALVVLMMAAASCSSSGESDASVAPETVGSVRPTTAAGSPGAFGDPATLGDLKVTVSNPVIESDADGPFLTLTVRAENTTPADVQSPQFQLRCSGNPTGGTWLTTSTFKQEDPVLSLSFNEGTLSLLLPGDDRLGGPRPSCTPPATIVATHLVFDNTGAGPPKEKRVGWAVPDELVAQLNAS